MNFITPYIILIFAVFFGTASNIFAKNANGFINILPSILSSITIILCMYSLSQVMKFLPVGVTYASFAGLCIIFTTLISLFRFNQIPNFYEFIGLLLIIIGVLLVNLLGQSNL